MFQNIEYVSKLLNDKQYKKNFQQEFDKKTSTGKQKYGTYLRYKRTNKYNNL